MINVFAPHSDWVMPAEFIDFSSADMISVDLETCDPDLLSKGPGWPWGNGHVAGVAIAGQFGDEVKVGYYPVGHLEGPNFSQKAVAKWLTQQLGNPNQPKVMFNTIYDLGWLDWMGVEVKGKLHDPRLAAALLDEHRRAYNLDSLAKDWLGESKNEDLLWKAGKAFGLKENVKAEMWKLPAIYVGPYAEQDALLNLRILSYVERRLAEEDLHDTYELECQQLRPLLAMRRRGVRVDVEAAEKLGQQLLNKEKKLLSKIKKETGKEVDIWSNLSLAELYDHLKLPYQRTEKGNPSFPAAWLSSAKDPYSKIIVEIRKANRARSTFSSGLITQHAKNGRIHCQFNQLKGDNYGTVSGRYSSSTPNLQQIPARDPEIGPMVRSLFLPEQGQEWCKADYSQQEPRLTVHYAALLELRGAEEAVEYYQTNANPDYHQMVADMAKIDRKPAKTINLGLAYGMGITKLADQLDMTLDQAKPLFDQYHKNVPFVKALTTATANLAQDRGFIRTLLKRRCRFPFWESCDWDLSKQLPPDPDRQVMQCRIQQVIDEASRNKLPVPRPGVRRAHTYRAMNRLIQGSAADMTKKALVDVYEAGYLPHLQVHDELDFSVETEKDARNIKEIMENVVKLKVPIKVDVELGPSWGAVKKLLDV